MTKRIFFFCFNFFLLLLLVSSGSFTFDSENFYMNDLPYIIRSGEMHYARIPPEYWTHRIQMVKSMGMNTIATYVFWNFHQPTPDKFDFESPTHNLREFIEKVHKEGLNILLRPGPYTCAEWDFGGLPFWLLKYEGIRVRCLDQIYMLFVEKYIEQLSKIIREYQITQGGPIIMLQIENEYGDYGNDKEYLLTLQKIWRKNGIEIPFYTADSVSLETLTMGTTRNAVIGLDSGNSTEAYQLAHIIDSKAMVFSAESYTGWLTYWGNPWANRSIDSISEEVEFMLKNNKSFNLYVIHGGTSFGFWAGADPKGLSGYLPQITSYDYDAPISENGNITKKFIALRDLISKYSSDPLPNIPKSIPLITFTESKSRVFTNIWANLPNYKFSVQPKGFEYYHQHSGLILYRTKLIGRKNGVLKVKGLRDYGLVFVNKNYIGVLNRVEGVFEIEIPKQNENEPYLEILVEAMGRLNYGENILDRKGIIDFVTLDGTTLMNWEIYNLPLNEEYINNLVENLDISRMGIFFKTEFHLDKIGDTFIDVSKWKKGNIWINGNNLGRFWNVGPQNRLYCPASWLKIGENKAIIFDLHQIQPEIIQGLETLK